MKVIWALILAFPLLAENVPGRYIVELTNEPVATQARGQGRDAMRSPAAQRARARIRVEQAEARRRVQAVEGVVSASIENVQNALVVEIDDAKASRLAALPGVRKVYPVREFHLMLDHALPLHKIPEAWTQVGVGNAGAGIKIGILDSGVDVKHAGFNDGGFTAPDGFPRGDLAFTNNKVIVARSYVQFMRNADLDPSAADHIGHGTATAMAAAGVMNAGPLTTITGVAPRAFIGSYKVFGSPASNPTSSEDVILRAIDDAVMDGMDVINLSFGSTVAMRLEDDAEMQALERVAALGIVVVCSAGNSGPDPMTAGSPAGSPSVITVGASANDRVFSPRVAVAGGPAFRGTPGSASGQAPSTSGKLVDVAGLDGDGSACNPLAGTALTGAIALISRGTCNFEVKLNYAAAAGAVGAVVYNNAEGATVTMAMGTATLPAQMVIQTDGAALRERAAAGAEVTLDFAPAALYSDPQRIESFSASGPYIDFTIKPDLVAVGGSVYTAAQSLDSLGVAYDASGYRVLQGTSFSAPIVTGAAALLKAARPGLTAAQYRSLLVNTAAPAWSEPGIRARLQRAGAGNLDVLGAVSSTAAAAPVSLSFGASAGTIRQTRELTVWNLGSTTDTFRFSVEALRGNTVPELPVASVELEPGGSATIPVIFAGQSLVSGEYEGFVVIQPSRSTTVARTPYWHGVTSGQPRNITVIFSRASAAAGSAVSSAAIFRVTDESGLPVAGVFPRVEPVSGGGVLDAIQTFSNVPFAYGISVRLGPRPGSNVFRVQAGEITKDVTVIGQ